MGTLMYRHHRQLAYSVSNPPAIRPIADPAAPIAANTPNARPRSRASVKVVVSNDNAAGAKSAAKTPCKARAPISVPAWAANPPSADAPAKPTRPMANARRWPSAPLTRPPISNSPPNASRYAVITQCRAASEIPSASCAEGRAMFTIVPSRTTRSCAAATTGSVHHRLVGAFANSSVTATSVTSTPLSTPVRYPLTMLETSITVLHSPYRSGDPGRQPMWRKCG